MSKIIAVEIVTIEPHPNAENLQIVQVNTGEGEPLQIVCGAKNFKVGDKVPCALHGSKLPDGTKIKRGNLRGIKSNGMLCGAEEIGKVPTEDGLLILPPETEIGTEIH
jgi:phenylalanyl-tRNA synthetase beta chain